MTEANQRVFLVYSKSVLITLILHALYQSRYDNTMSVNEQAVILSVALTLHLLSTGHYRCGPESITVLSHVVAAEANFPASEGHRPPLV